MARGRASRGKACATATAALPSKLPNTDRHPPSNKNNHCKCGNCATHNCFSSHPGMLGHQNQQDVIDSIDYHWKILSAEVKRFLLHDPMQLGLRKLVEFWSSSETRIESSRGRIAESISGSSFFLALNYTFIGKIVEARALILNGAFLRQCIATPILELEKLSRDDMTVDLEVVKERMPIYCNGLVAASTRREAMDLYLHEMLPPDYQRRMTFASQAANAKNHVCDYVSLISHDWNSSSSSNHQGSKKNSDIVDDDAMVDIILVDSGNCDEEKVTVGSSSMLKTIFSNYAENKQVSLRSLRFSYGDRNLFLTEVGQKSLSDYGMKNLDKIHISNITRPKQDSITSAKSSKENDGKSSKSPEITTKIIRRGKKKFRRSSSVPELDDCDRFKICHSRALSYLFEEAEPKLKEIRQRLNSLNIQNTQPKKRSFNRRHSIAVQPIDNPITDGLGGKAGKVCFFLQVGAVDNLHKTTKPIVYAKRNSNSQVPDPIFIDLHGYTKEEATKELDVCLPQWVDTAMGGAYPWVIPVTVVCGGGNQILSESVDKWVRKNDRVSNAPKQYPKCRRRASIH